MEDLGIVGYITDVARATLPDKLWVLLRKGRRKGQRIAKNLRRSIDLRSARKALLRSDALSKDEKYLLRNVSLRVHPNDLYLPGGGRHYLSIGLTSLRCINAALDHAPHSVRTILVLPSGHGRILRFLKVCFPLATICACDIVPEAVEFCRREFDAEAIISNQDFAKVSLPGPFDRDRLLGLELRAGALDGAWGMVVPTGMPAAQGKPPIAARLRKLAPHAA